MIKNNNRTKSKVIRFSESEYFEVKRRAESLEYRNISRYVREMALNGLIVTADVKPLMDIARYVRNASSNINQIARISNASSDISQMQIDDLKNLSQLFANISEDVTRTANNIILDVTLPFHRVI